jgi:phosphoserine phosphatase RsbU/P
MPATREHPDLTTGQSRAYAQQAGDRPEGFVNNERAARWGAVFATGWLVVLALAILVAPSRVVPDPLLPLAPLTACALLSTRATAVFASAAVGLCVLSGLRNQNWDTPQQWIRFVAVLLISAAAVMIAEVRIRRETQFTRLSHIADAAQRAILPTLPSTAAGVNVAARYRPAAEDTLVGGDLYDCSLTGGRVRFLIGDFRGKGIGAIEQAARVIRAFRQSAAFLSDPEAITQDMDNYLTPFFGDEDFATALLVDVTQPGRVTLSNCGHPPPVMIRGRGGAEIVEVAWGLPLGLGGTRDSVSVTWSPGDRLLLYTDGLSEARDVHGEFPPLLRFAALSATDPLEEAVDGLLERVRAHVPSGELADDAAVVMLENGQDAAGTEATRSP